MHISHKPSSLPVVLTDTTILRQIPDNVIKSIDKGHIKVAYSITDDEYIHFNSKEGEGTSFRFTILYQPTE